jgi:hypothetical protein
MHALLRHCFASYSPIAIALCHMESQWDLQTRTDQTTVDLLTCEEALECMHAYLHVAWKCMRWIVKTCWNSSMCQWICGEEHEEGSVANGTAAETDDQAGKRWMDGSVAADGSIDAWHELALAGAALASPSVAQHWMVSLSVTAWGGHPHRNRRREAGAS